MRWLERLIDFRRNRSPAVFSHDDGQLGVPERAIRSGNESGDLNGREASGKTWERVNYNRVVAAFLIAERNTKLKALVEAGVVSAAEIARLLDAPDYDDMEQNYFRLKLLHHYRYPLVGEFPPDTEWFEVR
ncbi:MAG TPA: hypothetical protein VJY15_12640 [Candidatus Acidoferrum sp.]|nr:hypothetical protein [Candidatus Acidoferrum sp.]